MVKTDGAPQHLTNLDGATKPAQKPICFFGRFWQSYPWLGSADVAALFAGDLRGGQKEHDLSEMVASGYSCWVVEWA